MTEEHSSLTAKIDLILAREEIKELLARYSWHATRGEWQELVALFTVDGTFESARSKDEFWSWVGHDEIFANLAKRTPTVIPMVCNEIIVIDGDTAVTTCTMYTPVSPDTTSSGFIGCYHDKLRREDGAWRFAERRFETQSGSF
jgi:hypothetical protein